MIDLADYYSGGYFLIRAGKPDWSQLQTDLLPEKLISLSKHICPQRLSIYWGWKQDNQPQETRPLALDFGIPKAKFDEFAEWSQSNFQKEVDLPSLFFTLDFARYFIERFLPYTHDLYLIGTGLYKPLEEINWREPVYEGMFGLDKRIDQHLPMVEGGIPLGFEVVCFAGSNFADSMYCTFASEELWTLFGIRPNKYDLIETREEAKHFNDWFAEDEQQGRRGEPYPYAYWLLVSYPLSSQ